MDSQSFLESQQKKPWKSSAIREKLYAYMTIHAYKPQIQKWCA